ncbi:putative PIN and TRAM-domain containing protein precursor [Caloramator mitchellensis]|uniref:Putative PIN and TRAM-domain containing protein n=1 Tax=Caloramator mitchellensis TaxID=908809 RepID=A0A0R3JRJ9_CALMK|nr:PIN domain-containing protein [Caloramator mitchellensis]KRQ86073.1 putative PIN and TRAM-domain containing protein precursor [Caloramator mitchellensis]
MLEKIFKWILTIVGFALGYAATEIAKNWGFINSIIGTSNIYRIGFISIAIILFGIIFYIVSPFIIKLIFKLTGFLESGIQKIPTNDIILSVLGLIIGLLIANLLITPFARFLAGNTILSIVGSTLTLVVNIVFATLGVNITLKKKDDLYNVFTFLRRFSKDKKSKADSKLGISQPKILDTSVIIDGRILDILKTGFLEGPIMIPSFVLEELRHIADSSDNLKRARGRRGLDILNLMQKELMLPIEVVERDFENIQEVDSKLLKLCQIYNGKIITNDFNLNKVAEVQGVPVLNINELANAVKPIVIPGEEMNIHIIKDGKEAGQGVAYLDDGTMIVVEGGRRHVGEVVDVVVTSVLQTAAGRMIFAKLKSAS